MNRDPEERPHAQQSADDFIPNRIERVASPQYEETQEFACHVSQDWRSRKRVIDSYWDKYAQNYRISFDPSAGKREITLPPCAIPRCA